MNREVESRKKKPEKEEGEKPEEPEPDGLVIEKNKEPKSYKEKKEAEEKKKYEKQRRYLARHPEVNRRAQRIAKIRLFLLKNKIANDYDQATQMANDFYARGITTREAILLELNKQKEENLLKKKVQQEEAQAPEQKEQKPEANA